eukprot:gb/GECG01006562.1/.p1 GENE.gb/GECG01006562.1/~~gb/GECG01006562.1/.p1  ORF type:complete len:1077 (+),score=104.96 gb/GECG01006562.1/:1-3231(+)
MPQHYNYNGNVRPASAQVGRRAAYSGGSGRTTPQRSPPQHPHNPQRPKSHARGRSYEPQSQGILYQGSDGDSHSASWAAQKIASTASGGSLQEYAFGATLGKGTFGKVKLGKHLLTNEPVAIKILEKSRIKEIADVERVTREIKILKRARHDNVIQLFEVIDATDQIYLVMEYLDGGELFDYIVRKKRLTDQEARQFFHGVLDGLHYLHEMGVVHRDLKPENILLQPKAGGGHKVKIIDFGLSNLSNEGKSSIFKTACGSPCYAAPEMISGKKYYGSKSDMWSSGVVLFAMLAGYLPFEDKNTGALYDKILNCRYRIPDWITPTARDLLTKILRTDPAERITAEEALQHPWLREVGTQVRKYGPTSKNEMHDEVIHRCLELGLSHTSLVDSVCRNAHNRATTTYFLLAGRMERMGVLTQKDTKGIADDQQHDPESDGQTAGGRRYVSQGRHTQRGLRAASASPRARMYRDGELERQPSPESGLETPSESMDSGSVAKQNQVNEPRQKQGRGISASPQRRQYKEAYKRPSDEDTSVGDSLSRWRPQSCETAASQEQEEHYVNGSSPIAGLFKKLEVTTTSSHVSEDTTSVRRKQPPNRREWMKSLATVTSVNISIPSSTAPSSTHSQATTSFREHEGVYRTYDSVPDPDSTPNRASKDVRVAGVTLPEFGEDDQVHYTTISGKNKTALRTQEASLTAASTAEADNHVSESGRIGAVPTRPATAPHSRVEPRPPRSQPVVPNLRFGQRKIVDPSNGEGTAVEERESEEGTTTSEQSQDETDEGGERVPHSKMSGRKGRQKRRGRSKGIRFRPSSARHPVRTGTQESPRTSRSDYNNTVKEQGPSAGGPQNSSAVRHRGRQYRVSNHPNNGASIRRPNTASSEPFYHKAYEMLHRVYGSGSPRRPKSPSPQKSRPKPANKDPEPDGGSSAENLANDPLSMVPTTVSGISTLNQPRYRSDTKSSSSKTQREHEVVPSRGGSEQAQGHIPAFASVGVNYNSNKVQNITISISANDRNDHSAGAGQGGSGNEIVDGFKGHVRLLNNPRSPRFPSPRPTSKIGIVRNTMRPSTATVRTRRPHQ